MNWYVEVMKKYIVFSGRARRKEYWYFMLFNVLATFVLAFIDQLIGTQIKSDTASVYGWLSTLYSLAIVLPTLTVSVRRLHDTSHSGWWLFISLIPLIGSIVLLIFYLTDSQPGDNQYGPNPKTELETSALSRHRS
ncbi:MAG: DUF805 domain-containing protein [Anaerolineaceae bacterium]